MKPVSKYRFLAFLIPAILAAAACLCIPADADLIPMINAEILGGSSWFSGVSGSFSGNLSAELMPVFEFNDNLSFIPVYSGYYRGIKSASDLQSGGWLYQQAQDHSFSFRFIGILPRDFVLKCSLSFLSELTQESPSEDWKLGLYNFNRTSFDLDAEKSFADLEYPFTLCAGYGVYGTGFPNYQSLASTDYGKSLVGGSSLPGTNVFDYSANEISASFDILGGPRAIYKAEYIFTRYDYPDQKVADSSGGFTEGKRLDLQNRIRLSADYMLPDFLFFNAVITPSQGIIYDWETLDSNQNYFDAANGFTPTPYFYSRARHIMTFPLIMRFEKPLKFNLSVSYSMISLNTRQGPRRTRRGTTRTRK